jgi:Dienelactone hydrolase family
MKKNIFTILMILALWTSDLQAQKITAPGEFIQIKGSNGKLYRAFASGPADANLGILFVHDFFGITDATRKSAERLGALGYRTIAPTMGMPNHSSTAVVITLLKQRKSPGP